MTYQVLPTINFESKPGSDDLKFNHDTISREFQLRASTTASAGIVDRDGNPTVSPFTPGRPLIVTINSGNLLNIDIAAGLAITPAWNLINLDSDVVSLELPDIAANKQYIVAVQYVLVPSENTRLSHFGIPVAVHLE